VRQSKTGWFVLALVMGAIALFLLVRYLINHYTEEAASSSGRVGLLNSDESTAESLLIPAVVDTPTPTPSPTVEPTPLPVVVYISGAVQQPDVYEVLPDARVIDVVKAAGGLVDEADHERINLAAHVHDAQHIHVPRVGEDAPLPASADAGGQEQAAPAEPATDTAGASDGTVNINTATAAELEALPGIGDVMAQRIVDYRAENGAFATVEDLQNVQGIGPVLLDNIRAYVRVE
jgi:competence protein ComEA